MAAGIHTNAGDMAAGTALALAALLAAAAGTALPAKAATAAEAAAAAAAGAELLSGDDEWGCQLLLCFAGDWKSVSECHAPVKKFIRCRFRKHNRCSLPSCPSGDGSCRAVLTDDPWDPCPLAGEGLEDAPAGYLAEGALSDTSKFRRSGGRYWLRGSSSRNTAGETVCDSEGGSFSSKACVRPDDREGTALERYVDAYDCGDGGTCTRSATRSVSVYSSITWLEEQSGTAVDVYIDGKIYSRTRLSAADAE